MHPVPPIIDKYWSPIDWDVAALWRLDLPTEAMTIQSLEWHLAIPIWPLGDNKFGLTPDEVRADPAKFAPEYQRTLTADLTHPLNIYWQIDRWMILDGVHRLLKAKLNGDAKVHVRKVPASAITQVTRRAT